MNVWYVGKIRNSEILQGWSPIDFRHHPQHLDTPRQITDTAGNTVWQWDNTDPFGNNIPNENPNGAGQFSFNLRFAGQYFDRETNTHYNYFRDYDPSTGRYIQSDPIGLMGGSWSTYTYVNGNPLSYTDPLGLKPGDIFHSPDAAAVDAGSYARGLTPQSVEYGGWIYPSQDGYSYNLTKGSPYNIPRKKLDELKTQCTNEPVAGWHTHPWDSSIPKPQDSESDQNFFSSGDKAYSQELNLPIYLNAPSGVNRVVSPNGSVRIVK